MNSYRLTQMVKVGTVLGCAVALLLPVLSAEAAAIRVKCEVRADRSRVSVDGNDLAAGTYRGRVFSGSNEATSGEKTAVGDEVQFDFDSNADDIAAGATAISANFIQGNQVTGQILNSAGAVVTQALANCRSK